VVVGAVPRGDDPIDLITSRRSRLCSLPGVVLHRPRDRIDLRPTTRQSIATCNPLRCLVDLGAVDSQLVAPALESMLIAGLVSVRSVRAAFERHRAPGRHGIAALADALRQLPLGERVPDSLLETKMARLLSVHGIGGWHFHRRIAGHEVDFALPDTRIAIEVDGWATHGTRSQFEHDRRRDADIAAAGWIVVRFTWLQVTRKPAWVAARILATIESRS
jgi:very-short-patch-repair endonuclease